MSFTKNTLASEYNYNEQVKFTYFLTLIYGAAKTTYLEIFELAHELV